MELREVKDEPMEPRILIRLTERGRADLPIAERSWAAAFARRGFLRTAGLLVDVRQHKGSAGLTDGDGNLTFASGGSERR